MITREKLQQTICECFTDLGYKPRGFQPDVIYDIVDAFLNKGKQNVVCSLDTGAGKSIIGAVVSEVVDKLTPNDDALSSIIMMSTNALSKQYADSFKNLGKHRYFSMKGARNFPCKYLNAAGNKDEFTGEDCLNATMSDESRELHCTGCEYLESKNMVRQTQNLITNNSYFLVAALTAKHLARRKMHIFDEAHNINESFCAYTAITLSVEQINKFIKELSNTNGKCDNHIAGLITLKTQITDKKIGQNNYLVVLEIVRNLYKEIGTVLSVQATLLEKIDIVASARYDKMCKKYRYLAGKISEFFDNKYEHVFDDTSPDNLSVKTIFVGKTMPELLAKYNLFMSATITENFVYDTLNLDSSQTTFIDTPPVFPPENKPVLFLGKIALNYATMKDPDVITNLKNQVDAIAEHHKDDSGLVIVPSFYLGSQLAGVISTHKIFEHRSGMNLSDLIDDFKRYKGSGLLISPSIFEGLDFKDDASRFQIIVKSPYPSLGDKRIKYIADKYPYIYKEMTLIKIVQGIGRSIRSESDYAVTYCLDASTRTLFTSKLNIWKPRFVIKGN